MRGDHAECLRLAEECLPLHERAGDLYGTMIAYNLCAQSAFAFGELDRVPSLLIEALSRGRRLGGTHTIISQPFNTAAKLAHERGRWRMSAILFGAAQAAAEHVGLVLPSSNADSLDRAERLDDLRKRLGEDGFAAAWAEGLALSLDAAFALALDLTASDEGS
jgi:hypothetical protein